MSIRDFEKDRLIAWTILGQIRPQIGHVYGYHLEPSDDATVVTSFYDWSDIDQHWRDANIFPVVSEGALRATLGILDRTVRRGYPRGWSCVNQWLTALPASTRVDAMTEPRRSPTPSASTT